MVLTFKWRTILNQLSGGLACFALGLVFLSLAVASNADLLAFQAARQCAKDESAANSCYVWLSGRVTATGVRKLEDQYGPGVVEAILTIDLPVGLRTVGVDAAYLPLGKPQIGDQIEAKLWHGQVTDVKLAGVTAPVVPRPATQFLFLFYSAGFAFLIGLMLLVPYALDRRARYI